MKNVHFIDMRPKGTRYLVLMILPGRQIFIISRASETGTGISHSSRIIELFRTLDLIEIKALSSAILSLMVLSVSIDNSSGEFLSPFIARWMNSPFTRNLRSISFPSSNHFIAMMFWSLPPSFHPASRPLALSPSHLSPPICNQSSKKFVINIVW